MSRIPKFLNDTSVFSLEINYFKSVLETKGINQAARKIGKDAATVSRTVSRFEKRYGQKLFIRHKNGVTPTQAASDLYESLQRAQKALKSWSPIETERTIRIGFSPTIGYSHFGKNISNFLLDMNLTPEFTIASSMKLAELLKSRELDFILSANPLKFPGVISKKYASENLVLCSASGLLQKHIILNPDLIGLEKIVPSLPFERRWMVKDYFVIAKMIENSAKSMALLPESVCTAHPQLKIIKSFKQDGNIHALTWPGSIGVELLRKLF